MSAPRVWIGPNESVEVEVVSDTELVAQYMGGGDGPEDVVVRTALGETTAKGAFYAQQRPRPPTISAITPDAGVGGTRVTIHGSGFSH